MCERRAKRFKVDNSATVPNYLFLCDNNSMQWDPLASRTEPTSDSVWSPSSEQQSTSTPRRIGGDHDMLVSDPLAERDVIVRFFQD